MPADTKATYQIDPAHSVVEFSVKHMMFSTVKGTFTGVAGEIVFDPENPAASSVRATADVASVTTGDKNRDNHLRSPDFFDAASHPTLTLVSKSVEPTNHQGTYHVVADLTMHGVTKEIALEASHLGTGTDPWGGTRAGFTATTTINRKDWGLNYNAPLEAGGVLVSDQVKISLDVESVKQS
ncbi:MAG: YceI family protein [Chloroflexota bacterium]